MNEKHHAVFQYKILCSERFYVRFIETDMQISTKSGFSLDISDRDMIKQDVWNMQQESFMMECSPE